MDGTVADLKAMGAPAEIIEEAEENAKLQPFEVWEENWPAVEMFLRLSTQWNFAGMDGSRVGLNYQSIEFLFKIYSVTDPKEMLDGLRIMENAALRVMREEGKETKS